MKAPPFRYACPTTLAEALDLLAEHRELAQVLAGGQSLMPSLNFRLSSPELLIDINRITGLGGIERQGDVVRIGTLARHAEVEVSALVARDLPLIAQAIGHVAHPAIRNRGTFGGSLALADPAAELPACVVALGAEIVLASTRGERVVPAEDFFTGLFETAREPDELLVEVRIKAQAPHQRSGFDELARRHGDFAIVGIAAQAEVRDAALVDLRLVVFGSEAFPKLAQGVAAWGRGQPLSPDLGERMAALLPADIEPMGNLQGSAETKRHLAQVLCRRLVNRLLAA